MAHSISTVREPGRTRATRARDAGHHAPDAIDYGPLATWIGFNLRMAQTAAFQAFAREAQDLDLRPGRFAILSLIGQNPGISQTALSQANGRDKSTMTPALNDLVRRGLINRARVTADRRSYQLTLTSQGEVALRRLREAAERHERNLDRIVGQRDRTRLLDILRKIRVELGSLAV